MQPNNTLKTQECEQGTAERTCACVSIVCMCMGMGVNIGLGR